jgi:hypothetical protein
MRRGIIIAACLALLLVKTNFVLAHVSASKVRVHPLNPHYLQQANGNPVVLIGFGTGVKNAPAVLDRLKEKVNYLRTSPWVWSDWLPWRPSGPNDPVPGAPATTNDYGLGIPFAKNSQGLWDLDRWNESFWTNLRDYLNHAQSRNFIVGLTIWDGHSWLPGGQFGDHTLWNCNKNAQGIQWAYDYHALIDFPSPRPIGGSAEKLVYYQRRVVDRLVSEVTAYPNIIIELNNERPLEENWFLWWAQYMKNAGFLVAVNDSSEGGAVRESTFGSSPILDMWSMHTRTDASITPARYKWNKIIVADADNSCRDLDANAARKIAWRSFAKGGHWNDFVCPETAYPDSTKIDYYGKFLDFLKTRKVPFVEMSPNNSLASTGNVLVKPGSCYLAYVEAGFYLAYIKRRVNVDLTGAAGRFGYEWYNARTGQTAGAGQVEGGATRAFSVPGMGDFVLWVRKATLFPPLAPQRSSDSIGAAKNS